MTGYGAPGAGVEEQYNYGNHALMRRSYVPNEGAIPIILPELVTKLGWLAPPDIVSSNRREYRLYDLRSSQGIAVMLPISEVSYQFSPFPGVDVQAVEREGFWISYHSGVAQGGGNSEDGEPSAQSSSESIYRSKGIMAWHTLERRTSTNGGPWSTPQVSFFDFESAGGRESTPWSPANSVEDPVSGYDAYDRWPSPHTASQGYWSQYHGVDGEFFTATPGSSYKSEFSYRSNPSTFGQPGLEYAGQPPSASVVNASRRTPQSTPTSAMLEVLAEGIDGNGVPYADVNLLLAPFEDVLFPNGPGDVLLTNAPAVITWGMERSYGWDPTTSYDPEQFDYLVIDEVDIFYSANGGGSWVEIDPGISKPNVGFYEWTPSASDISEEGLIRVVFHNQFTELVGTDESDQAFAVRAAPITFTDASAESQLASGGSTTEQTAASLSLQVDGDSNGYPDLITGMVDGDLRVYENQGPLNPSVDDHPRFSEAATDLLRNLSGGLLTNIPLNARGLSSGDIDNDFDGDLFIALGPDPDLGTPQQPFLANSRLSQSSGVMWQSTALPASGLEDAWSGAFGDFDGDGRLDLYVARCAAEQPTALDFNESGVGLVDVLLHNEGSTFVDAVSAGLAVFQGDPGEFPTIDMNVETPTIGARWADVDNDGDQDLFVAWLAEANTSTSVTELRWSPYFINLGSGGGSTTVFRDRAGAMLGTPKFPRKGYVSDAHFADFDADGNVDIALARQAPGAGQQNVLVCLNDGTGNLSYEPPGWGINGTGTLPMHSLEISDVDQNGRLDLLAAPVGASDEVLLYYGFDDASIPQAGYKYHERGQESGLDTGSARSITLADFNQDGDDDLFLGRVLNHQTTAFFFTNGKTTPIGNANANNFVRIRVQGGGGINASAVGSLVRVTAGWVTQSQLIDGGGGMAQKTGVLTFGIGAATSAEVEVTYPNGLVASRSGLSINGPVNVVKLTPAIQSSSIVASYTAGSSYNTLHFEFETVGDCDFVRIQFPGKAPAAPCGTILPADKDLAAGEANVSWTKVLIAPGIFHHTVSWSNVTCVYPCSYNYTIEASLLGLSSTSSTHQISIGICGGIQE